ncbi:MAG: hypothetical protein ABJA98_15850 [Acidobacteriota bacterium]
MGLMEYGTGFALNCSRTVWREHTATRPFDNAREIGLPFKRRFWEDDDGSYSGISRTDLDITQISEAIHDRATLAGTHAASHRDAPPGSYATHHASRGMAAFRVAPALKLLTRAHHFATAVVDRSSIGSRDSTHPTQISARSAKANGDFPGRCSTLRVQKGTPHTHPDYGR